MPRATSADHQPHRRIGLRRVRAGVRSGDRRGAPACDRGPARLEARARARTRHGLPADGREHDAARRPAGNRAHLADRPAARADAFRDPARVPGADQLHGRHRAGCAGRRRPRSTRGIPALHPPRTARRRPGAGAVELSVPGLGECRRPGHHGRQRRDSEDGAADAARRREVRGGIRGGRPSAAESFSISTPVTTTWGG